MRESQSDTPNAKAKSYSSKLTSISSSSNHRHPFFFSVDKHRIRQLSVHRKYGEKITKETTNLYARCDLRSFPLSRGSPWLGSSPREGCQRQGDDLKLAAHGPSTSWAEIPFSMILATVRCRKIEDNQLSGVENEKAKNARCSNNALSISKAKKERKPMHTLHPADFLAKTRATQHSALTGDPLRCGST